MARQRAPAPPEAEEISEDLLETIPDVDGEPPHPDAPQGGGGPGGGGSASTPVRELIAQIRGDLEEAFRSELDRIEKAMSSHIEEVEVRLHRKDEELGRLAAERQALLERQASHEKRWRAIREMAASDGR